MADPTGHEVNGEVAGDEGERAAERGRRAASRTAAAPSSASPATVMSGADDSRARNPARTSAWSSASSTLIMTSGAARRAPRREWPRTRNPPSGRAPAVSDPPSAAARSRIPGSPLPAAAAVRRVGAAVVVDLDGEPVVGEVQRHDGLVGVRVPAAVGQRLLHDPVRGQVDAGGSGRRSPCTSTLDRQPGRPLSATQLVEPGQPGGRLARRVLVDAAQHAERGAHLAQQFAAGPLDGGQRRAGLLGVVVHQVQRHPGLHVDQRDVVAEDVVQVAGEPEPLLACPPALGLLPHRRVLREPLPVGPPQLARRGHGGEPGEPRARADQQPRPGVRSSRCSTTSDA